MDIQLIILGAIAVFVIARLYAVLGQKTGAEPKPRLREAPARAPDVDDTRPADETPRPRQSFTGPAAAGLEAIADADPQFSPDDFTKGARRAYELIVNAFADGDRAALRTLVDDDVYEAYDAAIIEREKTGAEPMRLARVRSARIVEAQLVDGWAKVSVNFEAQLSEGDRMRNAREIWTFKRSVASSDPNWLLDEVVAAS